MKIPTAFCPLARFFRNPHHLSGVIFARLVTNLATLLWALIVLVKKDTLVSSGSRYAFVTQYIHENLLAAFYGSLALAQLWCMWKHKWPSSTITTGYALMSVSWGFVFFYNVIEPGHIFATATSLSATVAFIAFYAFLDGDDRQRVGKNGDSAG